MPLLHILAVGHGNCTVIESDSHTMVLDAPPRARLLDFLASRNIWRISSLLVSHADEDHLAGVQPLLTDDRFSVEHVYVNPEQARQTDCWIGFKIALAVAKRRGSKVHASLNATDPGELQLGSVTVEIVSPSPLDVLWGPGGKVDGRRLTANGLSAVCIVKHARSTRAVLPGDLDMGGVKELRNLGMIYETDILVFPHHGGRNGSDDDLFVDELLTLFPTTTILYSLGRRRGTPRDEVMRAVRRRSKSVYIACTGLAVACLPREGGTVPSQCAGDVCIDLESGNMLAPDQDAHQRFISDTIRTPLCRPLPSDLRPPNARPSV